VLSRAFLAFRAAFRAATLSALLSALSVSRFVAWALYALLSALSVSRFVVWALSALLSALSVSRFVAWALSALPRFPRCFPRRGRDGMPDYFVVACAGCCSLLPECFRMLHGRLELV
jgi:hypothetical protein